MGKCVYRPALSWPRHCLEVNDYLRASAALPPGKIPHYKLDRRLGGPQGRSGGYGEVKILNITRIDLRPLDRPDCCQSLIVLNTITN
jgi:hypothetical protein